MQTTTKQHISFESNFAMCGSR